ncbi:MAG: hypothetical protein K1W02_09200 [Muribaculaceae bacterium]
MGKLLLSVAALALVLTACDDGKIYDEVSVDDNSRGRSVVMNATISGCSDYAGDSRYSVALAAFRKGDGYAVVSKPLSDGTESVVLSNVPSDATSVEVCLINRLRERIFTYSSIALDEAGSTEVEFNAGEVDASRFASISDKIFSESCIQCHGATGHAAAGLDLMPARAYGMLVDVPSTVIDGADRVIPDDASASTLWQAVATGISSGWSFNHSELLKSNEIDFIENWINSGAK